VQDFFSHLSFDISGKAKSGICEDGRGAEISTQSDPRYKVYLVSQYQRINY
jgi:hypothetical protein